MRERAPVTMQICELPMGHRWLLTLRLETLCRNIAGAGGMETMYRIGRAHSEFDDVTTVDRRKTRASRAVSRVT